MKALKHVGKRDLQTWFSRGFAKGSTILTDGWKACRFLDEAGFKHQPHTMPGGWRSARHPAFPWVNTVLGDPKGNIKGVTRYLVEFQYRFNRRFDLKSILPRLLTSTVRTPAMPQRLLVVSWLRKAV